MRRSRPLRRTGPSPETRGLIMGREGGRCVACGVNVHTSFTGWSIQHRIPRGMGGRHGAAAALINDPTNLVLMCGSATTGCHHVAESNRLWGYSMGYLVRFRDDPSNVPLYINARRGWVLLTSTGGYIDTTAPGDEL